MLKCSNVKMKFMLDIKFIRQNTDKVKKGCKDKQVNIDIDKFLILEEEKRKYLKDVEFLRAEQNRISDQISKETVPDNRNEEISKAQKIRDELRNSEKILKGINLEYKRLMLQFPNLPLESVPVGKDEKDNIVLKEVGKKPKFDFFPKDYLLLAENLDLIDVKRAAKVSGSRFGYLKNEAVLLEFSIINFIFDNLIKKGFVPILPPVMIKAEMMEKMGYLAKEEEKERYFIERDNLCLIGTAEQSVGPMHTNEVFKEQELPKRYLGFSTCFRREAGSYGKDTRGILRVHQFDKIELFSFCKPKNSEKEHQFFLRLEEELMKKLVLPYRVIQICTGDMAFPTANQYDIETWISSQKCYRETHSTSNCTDFQARRLNIRYKDEDNKLNFVHMVNGTAFAIGRILIGIFENYQQKDGSIKIPKVLQKYIGKDVIKRT